MKFEEFLLECDQRISGKWESDRSEQAHSENDARTAAVLTRIDTGLTVAAMGYISKQLGILSIGVWVVAALLFANILISW